MHSGCASDTQLMLVATHLDLKQAESMPLKEGMLQMSTFGEISGETAKEIDDVSCNALAQPENAD